MKLLEDSAKRRGVVLREPIVRPIDSKATARSDWRELFKGIYLKRTLDDLGPVGMRLHDQQRPDHLAAYPLQPGLPSAAADEPAYGWITSSVGVIASIVCALFIDKVGRKRWYATAFLLATVPFLALAWLGATSAIQVLILATAAYADPADHRVLALPLLRRALPNPPARGRHRLRQRVAPGRIVDRPDPGGHHRRRPGHPIRVRCLRRGRARRWPRNAAVRDRDQGQGPRGAVALTSIVGQTAKSWGRLIWRPY